MLDEQLGEEWKEDMEILRTQEGGEDIDKEMEVIPSVRNRKIEMPTTTGKGMRKSRDREEELIGHAVSMPRNMIECLYCERQGALYGPGNGAKCQACDRQSPRGSAKNHY